MAVILMIETSTNVCSAGIEKDGECLLQKIDFAGQNHARLLPKFVEQLVAFAKEKQLKIDAVALSCGPGSYTGLRIGSSTTKGLCYGWNVPMIAVPTLSVLAQALLNREQVNGNALLCPMIDARRMEVYTALYDTTLTEVKTTTAEIIDNNSYAEELSAHQLLFFGNGADKCQEVIQHPNARFVADIYPSAESMTRLVEHRWAEKRFEDVAYFEPFYLKQFIATVPKSLI